MRAGSHVTIIALLLTACGQTPTAQRVPSPAATSAPAVEPALVGTWTTTVTKNDLVRVVPDFKPEFLCANAGTFVWTFDAVGSFSIDQTALDGCPTPEQSHIESDWTVAGNVVTFAEGTPDQEQYAWRVDGGQLTFEHQSGSCIPCKAVNTAKPWQRATE